METEKLFISDEALEKYGYAHFKDVDYDDYKYNADDEYRQDDDGILYTRDDMYNIYLCVNEDDSTFTDIDDIQNIIYIDSHIEVFNMRVICERAGVAYSTFRNWKYNNNYKGMSEYRIERIVEEMKKSIE